MTADNNGRSSERHWQGGPLDLPLIDGLMTLWLLLKKIVMVTDDGYDGWSMLDNGNWPSYAMFNDEYLVNLWLSRAND